MLHINGESNLNLPYYLFKSIEKMIAWVRNHPDHSSHLVFHHSLFKLLITAELGKTGRSWQHFIFWSGFESETQDHSDEEIRRQYIRHKRKVVEGKDEQAQEVCDNVYMTEISRTKI